MRDRDRKHIILTAVNTCQKNAHSTHLVAHEIHRAHRGALVCQLFLLLSGRQRGDIPILEGLVQTAANEPPPIWRERDAVHTVPMPPEPLDQGASLYIPDPDNGVQGPGSDEGATRGDGDRRDAGVVVEGIGIADGEDLDRLVMHIPDAGRLVAGPGDDKPTVQGKVKGVDLLGVTGKDVADALFCNVPDLWEAQR
ncbi:hypothetical protein J132_08690 [Termitomyces sp. J132]|nr:hypothetical protein J132_08690 [Termitomyces sp. J132]